MITLDQAGESFSAAYTAVLALELDEQQYQAGHGPCLDAAHLREDMRIQDMSTQTRWPHFTARGRKPAPAAPC